MQISGKPLGHSLLQCSVLNSTQGDDQASLGFPLSLLLLGNSLWAASEDSHRAQNNLFTISQGSLSCSAWCQMFENYCFVYFSIKKIVSVPCYSILNENKNPDRHFFNIHHEVTILKSFFKTDARIPWQVSKSVYHWQIVM